MALINLKGISALDITGASSLSLANGVVSFTVTGGAGITLKTNGVDNGSQSVLNLKDGSGISIMDDGVGGITIAATGGGTGTVTSVAFTAPTQFSVGGSPVTTSGTLALTWATQSANLILAGPTTGSAAAPTFRSLVTADIPTILTSKTLGTNVTITGTLTDGAAATGPSGYLLSSTGTGVAWVPAPSGSGTVTSVAMTGDGVIFNSTVTGSPVTTTGTLVPSLISQVKNTFFAGPTTGSNAAPTFRVLDVNDFNGGTSASSSTFWRGDGTWASAVGGPASGENIIPFRSRVPVSVAGWANYSFMVKMCGRTLLCQPTSWKFALYVGGSGNQTYTKAVVYTTARDSLVVTAVTNVTFGGVGTDFVLTPGETYSDAISLTLSSANDYFIAVHMKSTSTNTTVLCFGTNVTLADSPGGGSGALEFTGGYQLADLTTYIVTNTIVWSLAGQVGITGIKVT